MLLSYLKEHYGDIASVVALLITLVGFYFTIRNTKRAKEAAEDARRAARETMARIGSQLLSNEIAASLQLVREVDAACRERSWNIAAYRCDEVRTRLARLLENPGLRSEELERINAAIADFGTILGTIPAPHEPASRTKDVPPRVTKRLHAIITDLAKIEGRIHSETLSV
jgi:hypothetical protein